jgi:hypothetical protein
MLIGHISIPIATIFRNSLKCKSYTHMLHIFHILYTSQHIQILLFMQNHYQQMHKESFIINRNTLLQVSTLLGHLQGELFVIVTLRLHFTVE